MSWVMASGVGGNRAPSDDGPGPRVRPPCLGLPRLARPRRLAVDAGQPARELVGGRRGSDGQAGDREWIVTRAVKCVPHRGPRLVAGLPGGPPHPGTVVAVGVGERGDGMAERILEDRLGTAELVA